MNDVYMIEVFSLAEMEHEATQNWQEFARSIYRRQSAVV